MYFEIYKDKSGEFRARLVASNGEKICWTEGYTSKQSAQKSIEIMMSAGDDIEVKDNS